MRLRRLVTVVAALLVLTACGGSPSTGSPSTGSPSTGSPVEAGAGALRWGDGDRGVVLAHGAAFDAASWTEQAELIAGRGFTVVAVEDISPEAIAAAVQDLRDEGIADVALVGGSAGADAILRLAAERPELPDQLIVLSPNSVVDGLGEEPKLFIASQDESVAEVSTQLAAAGPGPDNQVVLLPGSAHAQNIFDTDQREKLEQLIVERLGQDAAS